MSESVYTPGADDFIKDPYVVQELARISAAFKALQSQQTDRAAEKGLDDHTAVAPKKPDNPDAAPEGVRWLSGPWLLNADGYVKGKAAIRPPAITGTVNDYAPDGIDSAIMLELNATANVSITGIKIRTRQRRFLQIVNISGFTISLVNQSTSSQSVHQFSWGTTGDAGESLGIPTGQMVLMYYDAFGQKWKLCAIPVVGSDNLPPSIEPEEFQFPPSNDWFCSRITNGVTALGIGESAPTLAASGSQAALNDQSIGFGRSLVTGVVSGDAASVQGNNGALEPLHDPTWEMIIKTGGSVAAIRIWCIFTDNVLSDADTLAGNYMGFRYSTVAGDGGWVGVTRDGTTQTVTATVAAIGADTVYRLRMRKSGTSIFFSVNGSAEVEKTTNLPTSTAQLNWRLIWYTQAAVAKTISWFRHWVKFGVSPS